MKVLISYKIKIYHVIHQKNDTFSGGMILDIKDLTVFYEVVKEKTYLTQLKI